MKNNRRTIILISLTLFSLNNCMAHSSADWKKIENKTKKDCVDCYANIDGIKKESVYSYDDSKSSVTKTHNKDGYKYQLSLSDTYGKEDNKRATKMVTFNDKLKVRRGNYKSKKIAIQVGAFRQYSGAKVYAKKYAILSANKYKVEILAGAKDQKPIYRVRIEGFSSRAKAKEFKKKYSLTGAFLVLR